MSKPSVGSRASEGHGAGHGVSPPATPDLLEAIVAATRHAVAAAERRRPLAVVERAAAQREPQGQAFRDGLTTRTGMRVIAECKRRSPSRGVLRFDYDPVAIALAYESAGAAAISVLTEAAFFDGAIEHLDAVRHAVSIPLLRKDFVVTEYQMVEARAHGADAALLIVAALDDSTLRTLIRAGAGLGLACLVEIHNDRELARALEAGASIVGVNNRNLRTLEVDVDASRSLVAMIPEGVVAVAESGLRTGADLAELAHLGYDAFLVGEALMTAPDAGAALEAMLAEGGGAESG